ncbi:MAG: hypothetical protein WCP32_11710, partial [Bacteroidota bacterium]
AIPRAMPSIKSNTKVNEDEKRNFRMLFMRLLVGIEQLGNFGTKIVKLCEMNSRECLAQISAEKRADFR